jgi:hypothetical protein
LNGRIDTTKGRRTARWLQSILVRYIGTHLALDVADRKTFLHQRLFE